MNHKITLFILLIVIITGCQSKTNNITEMNTTEGNWQLIWSDEFNENQLNEDNWNRQVEPAGRFNEEWQRYTNSEKNAYIQDSCLVIEAIHESDEHGANQYTSARLNTAKKFTFTYGKISARMKLPHSNGLWPAFWMLGENINENGGDTPWPFCGEIDILELYGSKTNSVVEANVHYANKKGKHSMTGPDSYQLAEGNFTDDFHVFDLEWNEKELIWFVDGEKYYSVSIKSDEMKMFHADFFLLLNVAVGGTHAGRPDSESTFPQKMIVDWVRVYKSLV